MKISARRAAAAIAAVTALTTVLSEQGRVRAAEQQDKKPLKIGFLAPLTGVGAADGPLMVKGFQLYLDQIGNKMAGHPVEFKVEDDEGRVAGAVAKAKKLIDQDKINVLSGVLFTPLAYAVAPVADEAQIPYVVSVSAADDLSQRKRRHWVIRTGFTSSQISQPLGEYAAKRLHYKKIVAIGSDYTHPQEVVGGFQKTFEENGGQVIQKFWVPMDRTDFTDVVKKISPEADAVLLCLVGKPAEILPHELKEKWPKLPIIGSTTSFEESILQKIGPDLNGAISSNFYSSAIDTKANKNFVNLFRSKFGQDPGMYAMTAYTSAMWINKAVESLKGDIQDKEKFLEALKNVQLPDSPRGPLKLDSYGTVVQNIYIRKIEKMHDKWQNTVIETIPMVSQFYKTKPEEFLKQPVFSKEYPPCTHCISN